MTRYEKFARIAFELAAEADTGVCHQLCALIVNKRHVIAVGYNSPKTHPMAKTEMQQLHAEMHAIVKANTSVRGSDAIVARARPSGKPGLARPCKVCEKILRQCGIKRVFYTLSSEDEKNPKIGVIRL